MLTAVDGAVNLRLTGPREILNAIEDEFKYQPDKYYLSPKYIIWVQTGGKKGWDGWVRPGKFLPTGAYVIGRGWLPLIQKYCDDNQHQLNRSQLVVNPFADIFADDIPDDIIHGTRHPEQWELQKECIAALLRAGLGRVKVTVSGGKTAILCATAAAVKMYKAEARILYITPTERLVKQVATEARKFLPTWDIGQFGGAAREDQAADMVVATAAIMNKRYKELLAAQWFKSFYAIMCDECQYAASPSQQKVLSASRAWFRFGASDTTKEDDPAKRATLTGSLGPVLNEQIKAGALIALDQIATPTIEVVSLASIKGDYNELGNLPLPETPGWALIDGDWLKITYLDQAFRLNEAGEIELDKQGNPTPLPGKYICEFEDHTTLMVDSKWCLLERKFDKCIINQKLRNAYIVKKCKEWQTAGYKSLVIATRTMHVKILEAKLTAGCNPDLVQSLYGVHTVKERDEAFNWLKTTPGAILISPLVKVGVSINEIQCGVVADYVADDELANQLVGRFLRKKQGDNRAEIVWFRELQHRAYAAGSSAVIRKLKAIEGYTFREVSI